MYQVGTSKKEITAFKHGIGMMGYGMAWNTVHDVETPLHARAYVFHHVETNRTVAMVVADLCFVSHSVKRGVIKKLKRKHPELGLNEANVLLTAQHTHSGPGGYSHYGLYNITIPGFVPEVYQTIVDQIVAGIVEAWGEKRPSRLFFDSAEFAENIPVAFNRSMDAHLANPDAEDRKLSDTHLGVDREMKLLRMDGYDGEKIGAINWFGVHSTSVHNDNHSICWDNKGYAAQFMEQAVRDQPKGENFLGAFAQASAGDVTPNIHWDKKKKWTRGPYKDDFESARHNGRLQYELAREIYEQAPNGHEVVGGLDWCHVYVNFANVLADPEFAEGREDARTGPACHGLAFFAGTKEGPGMTKPVQILAKTMATIIKYYEYTLSIFLKKEKRRKIKQKYKIQGKKTIIIEAGERRVLGTSDIKNLIVPGFADETIRNFKTLHPQGWDEDKPWTPHILPLQIMVLGDLAFVAVPAEPTTIAGQRIRKVVEGVLKPKGIHRVLIVPYSNAYCGYISTNEEYRFQNYEGGHTVFGKWTCAAFQTKFKQLAEEMAKKADYRQLEDEGVPPEFTHEELSRRTYGAPTGRQDMNEGEKPLLSIL